MTLMSKKTVTFLPAYKPREEKDLELEEPEEPELSEEARWQLLIIELLKRNRAAKDHPEP
jgi:hypothetical protein